MTQTVNVPAGFRSLPLLLVQLSLAAVLKCGQSFRWSAYPLFDDANSPLGRSLPTHEYRFCLRDRVICLRQSPDMLFYRAVFPEPPASSIHEASRDAETLAWLKDYFQLDVDLVQLYAQWANSDPVFNKLSSRFQGIRMLRQDPWENLISFICSSNNNIARITKMVTQLCKSYSPPLLCLPTPQLPSGTSATNQESHTYHPFPPPSALAAPSVTSTLRSLGFGYRAEFIQRTAKMLVDKHGSLTTTDGIREVSEVWLDSLRKLGTVDAREELLKFVGVGRKVADCVLLMSLDKTEVVPVDTHVHQIAIKYYGMRSSSGTKVSITPKLYEEVNTKLFGIWGEYAGWTHSVLFTADLKSFSSFGLPTPPQKSKVSLTSLTPPETLSPLKRKRGQSSRSLESHATEVIPAASPAPVVLSHPESDIVISLAERVKRRRRTRQGA